MQAMEPPRIDKDKRVQILEAAAAVFSERGFHEAKMEEIATRAGVGKGTVYEYFSGKLALFQEMIRVGLDFYSDSCFRTLADAGNLRERIKWMFMVHAQFALQYRELAKVIFGNHTSINDEMRQWLMLQRERKIAELTGFLAEQKQQGQIRDIEPQLIAQILTGIIGALTYPIIFEDQEVDVEKAAEQVVDVVLHGIIAQPKT